MTDDESSVRVAVRIRPQLPKEVLEMCRICTTVTPGEPQVTLGTDKAFTYDYVFDTDAEQRSIYETCAKSLVQGSLEGYNATVFAYGQTGSGKTYTMGTGFDVDVNSELVGIIPRAINDLFEGIQRITEEANENLQPPPQFKITAQFLELYNEEIIDLFESAREFTKGKGAIKIHEDSNRSIYLSGVRTEKVSSPEEALEWLKQGSLARTTASTHMNAQSSRSHAIFTLHIRQQRVVSAEQIGEDDDNDNKNGSNEGNGDFETLSAKFHFVDLAGSERLKRTGATGDRAKEGISINCGLLALGNVISALGDQAKRALHVPYRDSKLTRLLQDSLGGNSRTLMIACVSPSDRDFMETLNTLNYANRARNIKNKVSINQDKSSRTVALLKKQIQDLQCELLEYKQGKRLVGEDGIESVNDMFHENTLLMSELESLRTRVKAMQHTIDTLKADKVELLRQRTMAGFNQDGDNKNDDMSQMVEEYIKEIEELRTKLMESESTCAELRKAAARSRNNFNSRGIEPEPEIKNIIEFAKKEIERETNLLSSRKKDDNSDDSDDGSGGTSDSDGEGEDSEENKHNEYSAELAQLTSEISVKQQLLEALEKSQKKMQNMKQHYEEKLMQLQSKIEATVKERDSVLASYSKGNNQLPLEKVKKVKEEYEQKLTALQREMKSLQTAKREHSRLLKNQGQYEAQIRTLSSEVSDMKKMKVKLMNKMKEETQRHKEAETRRNREIAQLKKQNRIDANLIKKMEAEKRAKSIVLKRKTEEVAALRTAVNQKLRFNKRANDASPRKAKMKWFSVEKNIVQSTINKQQMASLEREMNRKIEDRGEIQEELKQKKLLLSDPRFKNNAILIEEAENLQANLDHIQSSISDLQNEILLVEENKVTDGADILNTVVDSKEAAYILEKLYNMALHQSCLAAKNESTTQELQAEIVQLKKESQMQEQLLRHLVENQDKEQGRRSPNGNTSSDPSSRSTSPVDNGSISNFSRRENGKQRRKMMAPQDLLFQNENNSGNSSLTSSYHGGQSLSAATSPEHHPAPSSILAPPPLTRSLTTIKEDDQPLDLRVDHKKVKVQAEDENQNLILEQHRNLMTSTPPGSPLDEDDEDADDDGDPQGGRWVRSESKASPSSGPGPPPAFVFGHHGPPLPLHPAVLESMYPDKLYPPSNFIGRVMSVPASPVTLRKGLTLSPRINRKTYIISSNHPSMEKGLDASPPGSPPVYRRQTSREENVFSRLTSQQSTLIPTSRRPGKITTFPKRTRNRLQLTHTVEGHSKAVLALHATDDKLFTASKDRTVVMWDLRELRESQVFSDHANSVVSVKYSPTNNLLFSVFSCFVKVTDVRSNKVVHTLNASSLYSMTSSCHDPANTANKDLVNAVAISGDGNFLYTAVNERVRLWDTRNFSTVGKLLGGHQAAIMCLALSPSLNGDDIVVTGSKDHYIKVFHVSPEESNSAFLPRVTLEPPHYDGIQCLALRGQTLFSGSRDCNIKKWTLDTNDLVMSVNGAHKDWVTDLCFSPNESIVVSGSRDGYVKLWNVDNCSCVGEIRAHESPINALAANSSHVFSASNSGEVKMWKESPELQQDMMSMSTGSVFQLSV